MWHQIINNNKSTMPTPDIPPIGQESPVTNHTADGEGDKHGTPRGFSDAHSQDLTHSERAKLRRLHMEEQKKLAEQEKALKETRIAAEREGAKKKREEAAETK